MAIKSEVLGSPFTFWLKFEGVTPIFLAISVCVLPAYIIAIFIALLTFILVFHPFLYFLPAGPKDCTGPAISYMESVTYFLKFPLPPFSFPQQSSREIF